MQLRTRHGYYIGWIAVLVLIIHMAGMAGFIPVLLPGHIAWPVALVLATIAAGIKTFNSRRGKGY